MGIYLGIFILENKAIGSKIPNWRNSLFSKESIIGSLTNPQRISDTFKSSGRKEISTPTIAEYLTYLQDVGLISKAERYDVKGRKYIPTPVKYYYTDTGLRNVLVRFRQYEETHLMENVIYNELLYRGYSVDVGVVPVQTTENGLRVNRKLEIDFVANKGSKRYYLQSAFAIPDQAKMNQEQESLVRVPDSFKKIIITSTNSPLWRNEQGITIMSIYDFLLNDNSLESCLSKMCDAVAQIMRLAQQGQIIERPGDIA
ncbi:DUF4143 domain-containing protein [Porcincola intestinalis]|uniref:DUF4143 domain-containing protein n=1 Tax=Porcincola intestinalis TaxID=2606632 RepID=UPI0023F3E129|nr:DUF4143 domain-containing protein [Porcincola intestinalis]MDD7060710.1 DUF4143 domain-containing protein [Porcincola intestinalis]MDY5282863.1 DUF4143 domain-containing protein [Porcincola intestinalis]